MAIRTYKVTLDSKNAIAPEPVYLRQGDKTGAVVIDATLMDNGTPVSLSGLTPMFKANTADGQAVIADSTGFNVVDESGGEFTYQVPNALSSVPGKITTAYFSFSDSSGSESTFDVAFIIKKAVDITQAQANDYITIIDGTLQSLQQKIDAMNTDVQTILAAFNQGDFYNRAQTDDKDTATLASAKSYADAGDATTLASAKAYADIQLAAAKTYTDSFQKSASMTYSSSNNALIQTSGFTLTRIGNLVWLSGYSKVYGMNANNQFLALPAWAKPSVVVNAPFFYDGSNAAVFRIDANATSLYTTSGVASGSYIFTNQCWLSTAPIS